MIPIGGPALAESDSLNLLTINYEYPPLGGGGGVVHELMAEELARRHRVHVVTSAFGGLPAHEVRNRVEIHRIPILGRRDASVASLVSMLCFPPSAWACAARLARRERFDLVHAHFAVPTGPASLAVAELAGIPHILTIHGGDIYDPSKRLSPHRLPPLRPVIASILRRSDAVVAQSRNTRDNARQYYGYEGPIEIIPLGIRQPPYPPATREELGLPRDAFLAVTVGRLVKRKAVDRLLAVLARPRCAAVHLLVVGTGPELEPLRDQIARLSLDGRVRLMGRVEETAKWQVLSKADVYVSSTLHEGFGLVYLEAMAAGLPVITPDHGGQVDFLENGVTGYVVPAGDLDALEGALVAGLENRDGLRRMGAGNRARAEQYRIERCARAHESLYRRVLDQERAGGPPVPIEPMERRMGA